MKPEQKTIVRRLGQYEFLTEILRLLKIHMDPRLLTHWEIGVRPDLLYDFQIILKSYHFPAEVAESQPSTINCQPSTPNADPQRKEP